MSKEYLMFVDERGYYSNKDKNDFSIIGVIIEKHYCTDSEGKESELTDKLIRFKKQMFNSEEFSNVNLCDIVSRENVFSSDFTGMIDGIVVDLPILLKNLKFSVISTSIKQDRNRTKDLYDVAVNNLIKRFYSFLVSKQAKCGGIIVEGRHDKIYGEMPQKFFDIYIDRGSKFFMYKDITKRINKFMICERYNKKYKGAIDLSNTINNVLLNVLANEDDDDIKIEYGNFNKILKVIQAKTYKEEVDLLNDNAQRYINLTLNKYAKESQNLKQQLVIKNKKISEKEQEITDLTKQIMMLKQKLNNVMINKTSDNIIFDILSEVDVKIKGMEKQSLVNVNN